MALASRATSAGVTSGASRVPPALSPAPVRSSTMNPGTELSVMVSCGPAWLELAWLALIPRSRSGTRPWERELGARSDRQPDGAEMAGVPGRAVPRPDRHVEDAQQ